MEIVNLVPRKERNKAEELESAMSLLEGMKKDILEKGISSLSAVVVQPSGNYKIYTSLINNHLMTLGALVECIFQRQDLSNSE
jgi:hypothetical protein